MSKESDNFLKLRKSDHHVQDIVTSLRLTLQNIQIHIRLDREHNCVRLLLFDLLSLKGVKSGDLANFSFKHEGKINC